MSQTVGFVVPDITNWFYSAVFVGAQEILREASYDLVLATSDGDYERQAHAIEAFVARSIDGFILSLADENPDRLPIEFNLRPSVLLDRELFDPKTGLPLSDMILSDHGSGIRAAVSYLVDLGHRRIALLTGSRDLYTTRSRSEAFHRTSSEFGLAADDVIERAGDRSVESGERNTHELLSASEPPTAIICGSNQLLHGALRALSDRGSACPGDVSIIASDDSDICRLYRPAITVVRRDVNQLGREAATALLYRLASEGMGELSSNVAGNGSMVRKVLPTELVLRGSTGPPNRTGS